MKIRDTARANEGRIVAGAWLKGLREASGLSQSDLAALIEAPHYTYISQMETGRRSIPTYHIDDFARALGWSQSAFAKALISHQDPFVHAALFESEEAFKAVKVRALAPKPAADQSLDIAISEILRLRLAVSAQELRPLVEAHVGRELHYQSVSQSLRRLARAGRVLRVANLWSLV